MERAELAPPPQADRIEWLELSRKAEASLSPLARAKIAAWQAPGREVRGHVVCGPAFWQTAETSECPGLIAATLAAVAEPSRA